ncbi:unnamed protein product [Acanthoscelides obtectus]|uniref:Uncharacterized protein n=1 Tax=Acanthoscelides obtectus TaxID=200917 RepID=A0A9P0M894_ACAOB|nr:unnamed protein product [Acanthoscelides obtectus]CAK1629971.1 hypothetical protein AOBTE_LOCUS6069 [Acanthoscelides obtectus]
MAVLKGWRYAALIGGLFGAIAITVYPIIIDPMLNPDKYKRVQEVAKAQMKQYDPHERRTS